MIYDKTSSLTNGWRSWAWYIRPFKVAQDMSLAADKKILLLPLDRFGIVKLLEKNDRVFKATQLLVRGLLRVPGVNSVVLSLFDRMGAELSVTAHDAITSLANKSVTELTFNARPYALRDTAFTRILEAVKEYNHLQKLHLTDREVDDARTIQLEELLRGNSSLTELELRNNIGITSTGAQRLAKGLESNKTLQKLELSCTAISDVGAEKLLAIRKGRNPPLKIVLSVSNGNLSSYLAVQFDM